MIFRSESKRERTLLRLIQDQQRIIERLNQRLMDLSGRPPVPEYELPFEQPEEEEQLYSALESVPPTMEED